MSLRRLSATTTATTTAATAAAALSSSRRGAPSFAALSSSRRGAPSFAAFSSSRRGAASFAAFSSQRCAPSAVACYRGGSLICRRPLSFRANGGQKGSVWDEIMEYVLKAAGMEKFAALGGVFFFAFATAGFSVWYVDHRIQQEGSMRVHLNQKIQEFTQQSFATRVMLQSKLDSLLEKVLAFRKEEVRDRQELLGAAEQLKNKGYVVVPIEDFQKMKELRDQLQKDGYVFVPDTDFDMLKVEVQELKELLCKLTGSGKVKELEELLSKLKLKEVDKEGSDKSEDNCGAGGNNERG